MNRAIVVVAVVALLISACVGDGRVDEVASVTEIPGPSTTGTGASTAAAHSTQRVETPSNSTTVANSSMSTIASPSGEKGTDFVDSTATYGLVEPLTGMLGHAAAWGDVDGDGAVDLVVGSFGDRPVEVYQERGAAGPSPDRLLLNGGDRFGLAGELGSGRTSGAVIVDLDGDHDKDLVMSRNVKQAGAGGDPTIIFENVAGSLVATPGSDVFSELGGRTIGVLDENGDGLLDLFFVEDRYAGGSSRLFRNMGDLTFVDVTEARGLPTDIEGLGIATVDLDGDHRSDLFVSGSNRLFLGTDGGFAEVDSTAFVWETFGDEDLVAGVGTGDLDRDGRLDLVVGHHFNSTVDSGTEVPVRVYMNRSKPGELSFVDVTDAVGMVGLPTKAPHVEIVDLDNDGWPDILTSASAGAGTVPAVFMHQGMTDGLPRFSTPTGLGSHQYWVAAPTADFDRDLRVDVFAVEWEPALPSRLFRNERAAGNAVRVEFVDVPAVGSKVSVFETPSGELIGYREVVASAGYSAGIESVAHFGIGDRASVDMNIRFPDGTIQTFEGVPANAVVTVSQAS